MKITDYRKGSNQYKKKSKWKVLRNWAILIVVVWLGVSIALNTSKNNKDDAESTKVSQKDICEGDAGCQAKIENLASQTLLQNQIKQVRSEYDAKLAELEGRLAEKKAEALSFK